MDNLNGIDLNTSYGLSRLRDSTPKLNQACDRATKIVSDVEKILNDELSVGIYADVLIDSEDNDYGVVFLTVLAYQRHNSKYRIVIAHGMEGDPSDWVSTAFAECKRDDKLAAIKFLPELVEKIADAVDDRVAAVSDAIDQASNLVK